MKVGIVPINVNMHQPEEMVALARKAEEVGLESIWTFEHVIVPLQYDSRYPYNPTGKMGATPETPFVDPLIALSFLAAHTKNLRLATGVNILPQANPLLLAKQAASIDFVSQGRLLLGLGTGWLREEYAALGTPFERRGARFDDAIHAMKKVWSGDVVEHQSEFIQWSGFKSYPLPVQRPHPPLIIGGATAPALRRVVQHGDGWFVPSGGVDRLRPQLDAMRAVAREHGRDPSSIELTAMWPFALEPDAVSRYEDLGVARLVVMVQLLGTPDPMQGLERLAEKLAKR
jgi:probable F420-dependent oxidoreductase